MSWNTLRGRGGGHFDRCFYTDWTEVIFSLKASLLFVSRVGARTSVAYFNVAHSIEPKPPVRDRSVSFCCLTVLPLSIEWHLGQMTQSIMLHIEGVALTDAVWEHAEYREQIGCVSILMRERHSVPTGQRIQMSTSPLVKLKTCSALNDVNQPFPPWNELFVKIPKLVQVKNRAEGWFLQENPEEGVSSTLLKKV